MRTRPTALSRRRFCLALAAATCACAPGRSAEPSLTPVGPRALPTVRALPTTGRLLVVHAGNFFRFDLASLQETPLSHFPKNADAAAPALSPDGKRVAYGYYVIPADPTNVGGGDLCVVDASGGDGRLVRLHPGPDAGYEEPCWTADGQALLATLREPIDVQGQFQGERQSIVRVGLDGSEPISLVDNGQSPTASPDGKSLAYLGVDTQGRQRGLWVADAAGKGARDLLAGRGFRFLRAPRFAPDGSRIAFAAAGGPGTPTPEYQVRAWPFVGVAQAHNASWEIWTVRPDGTEPRRLTHEGEDSPTPAWSPDGKWIAFAGEIGRYLVDAADQQTLRFSPTISTGGIVWLRED